MSLGETDRAVGCASLAGDAQPKDVLIVIVFLRDQESREIIVILTVVQVKGVGEKMGLQVQIGVGPDRPP